MTFLDPAWDKGLKQCYSEHIIVAELKYPFVGGGSTSPPDPTRDDFADRDL